MAPNSPACSFIHASIVGSRSTAPSNRKKFVLIDGLPSALELIFRTAHPAPYHCTRPNLRRAAGFLRSFARASRRLALAGGFLTSADDTRHNVHGDIMSRARHGFFKRIGKIWA